MEHVRKNDLVAYFFAPSNRALHAKVAHHLLAGCGDCHEQAKDVLGLTGNPRVATADQALTVFFRESSLLRDEKAKAAVNWAHLASLDERERIKTMTMRWRYKKYGLAAYVLEEAETLAARGKREAAKDLVGFSAAVTGCLPQKVYGAAPIADLKLRQNTVLSNILRLDLDFVGALAALQKAEKARSEGIDLAEKARFSRVQASILFDLGDFDQAAKAAREAGLLYGAVSDLYSKGRALLQESMILANFDPHTGLERANQGLSLLNPLDCYPFVSGVFYKAYCLIKLGMAENANDFISSHREIIRELADPGMELWYRHLDALILNSRGQTEDAEVVLVHVALRFREEGMIKEMILQHLERIKIKVETGRWKSAISIATRLTPELARLGLRNDLLAMWASLQDALSQRRDAVSEIENLFRRRWNAPGPGASRKGIAHEQA